MSRPLEDYKVTTRTALAARQLIDEGISLHPGKWVGYMIADAKACDKGERVTIRQDKSPANDDVAEYVR